MNEKDGHGEKQVRGTIGNGVLLVQAQSDQILCTVSKDKPRPGTQDTIRKLILIPRWLKHVLLCFCFMTICNIFCRQNQLSTW